MKRHKVRFKIELLYNFIEKNNLTIREFCKNCGISQGIFYRLKNGQSCRITPFYKICVFTKIKADDFLEDFSR